MECWVLLGAVAVASCMSAETRATTRVVAQTTGAQFQSIQGAILASTASDTVLVEPGTYREHIDFLGKNLYLASTSGAAVTIVDGSGSPGPVVAFLNGESSSATLAGLTITGGSGFHDGFGRNLGGGVYANNSTPTILSCVIRGNRVEGQGIAGGVYLSYEASGGASTLISDCDVFDNYAGSNAGGVLLGGNLRATVLRCTIHRNQVIGGDGGGIYAAANAGATLSILDSSIYENVADDHGGGIYCTSHGNTSNSITISRTTLWNNVGHALGGTGDCGGGIWCEELSGSIDHNTLVRNRSQTPGENALGGSIVTKDCPNLVIANNIIAYTLEGGGLTCVGITPATVSGNIFWNNVGGSASGSCQTLDLLTANKVVDPLFCDLTFSSLGVAANSPAFTLPGGYRGAIATPACQEVSVRTTTWSRIKLLGQ